MRIFLSCVAIFCLMIWQTKSGETQINLKDALYLTKNSIKELRKHYRNPEVNLLDNGNGFNTLSHPLNYETDIPFNNVVNTFFPVDCLIKYNEAARPGQLKNSTEHEFLGRYASFSPIINEEINGQYLIFPNNACQKLNSSDYEDFNGKIIVLMRGGCTFVNKVSNIIEADFKPQAIIIGNNEPNRGLVSMYSSTYNEDGSLATPIIFITYESFKILENLVPINKELVIFTVSIGGWFNIILSMSLSPPLLILIFYMLIKGFQLLKKREVSRINNRLVRSLPVYVYNKSHLILSSQLPNYLKITGQDLPTSALASTDSFKTPAESSESLPLKRSLVLNGVDLTASANALHILLSPNDFYPSYKCSICLEKFKPLVSKVLVLECKHFYHESCLSNWLINFKRSCPLCNQKFKHPENPYLLVDSTTSYGAIMDDVDLEAQISPTESNSYSENVSIDENAVNDDSTMSLPIYINGHENNNTSEITTSETSNDRESRSTDSGSGMSESQSSYFSTASKFESNSSNRFVNYYLRPLQILVRISSQSSPTAMSELSSSIDLEKFGTPENHLSDQSSSKSSVSTILQRDNSTDLAGTNDNRALEQSGSNGSQNGSSNDDEDYFDDMVMA